MTGGRSALTPQEQKLVLRAVRELAAREESAEVADLMHMLEHATAVGQVAALDPNATDDPVREQEQDRDPVQSSSTTTRRS